jgi:GntR family transcriptional regulator / MocR family aminotransferase
MARMRTSSALELLVPLRRNGPEPLHRQLEQGIREAVRSGRLAAGAALPSTRALAAQLAVSRGIVVEAYEQLGAEGYLAITPGGATRVAILSRPPSARRPRPAPDTVYDVDFRPGRPDLDLFPRETWLRSVRRALDTAPSHRLGYLDGRGMPELRAALADYLNRVRGTAADPDSIVVCAGFAQGLKLVAQVLRDRGARRIAIEDPTQPETAADLHAIGLEVVGIPVDRSGMRVEQLDSARVQAAVLTAAHQYPTGGVLPPERRATLIDWAERRGGLVIEDDYDAEFRYDREPVGAMQGLSPERVVYAGSTSKILAPGLRLGWIVVPAELADQVAAAKKAADLGSPAIDQLAFADFLAHGELDRHLRRLRPIYRARRDVLLAALGRHLPELRPVGASAGLHLLAWLPPDLDELEIIEAAARGGIRLQGVGSRRDGAFATAGEERLGGLIFGYGTLGERALEPAVERLAAVIEGVRRGMSSHPATDARPVTGPPAVPSA